MKTPRHTYQAGAVSGSLIAIIGLIILVIGFGGAAIWAYSQYDAQKTNVNGKIDLAIAKAKKDQGDVDDAKFAERDKEPNRQFVGPDDYGRLTFNYPKTWSVYEATDVTQNGGTYEAYLNPVSVPPISSSQQFGLRVTIEARNYDQIVSSYDSLVKKGDLHTSSVSANGNTGTRLDGSFSTDIRGSAVIFKIRDKTVTIRTDADTFKPDFENIIKTINFNN
jgi:hypothetical protein